MELPFNVLLQIALVTPGAWRAMIAIPAIGRWSRTHSDVAIEQFIKEIKHNNSVRWVLPNGQLHSVRDRPAVSIPPSKAIWYRFGKIHRDGAPAQIDKLNKTYIWYSDGVIHRDGAPAIVGKFCIIWMFMGEHHRVDGPALIWNDGCMEWWHRGERSHHIGVPYMNWKELREYGLRLWCKHARNFVSPKYID